MRLIRRLRRFRNNADIRDELSEHLDALTQEGVDAGLPRAEAQRRARLQLGDSQVIVEKVREGEFATMWESWYRDLHLGLRSLWRNPIFSITAILTLAVGIGANTAIFTVLHGLLLRSLPVTDPGQLIRVGVFVQSSGSMPYPMIEQLQRQQQSFTDLSAWMGRNVTIEGAADSAPRLLQAGLVTGNAFEVLGLQAHIGRLLSPADDAPGAPSEGWPVVLAYGFWRDQMGGDPEVIGRQFRVTNTPLTVVGVAPPEFRGVWAGSDYKLYLPIQFINVILRRDAMNDHNRPLWCNAIGRLKPGATVSRAQAELSSYQQTLFREFIPKDILERPSMQTAYLKVESARNGLPTFFEYVYAKPLYLMQGLVAIVLLLCCVNIGGLMMSKVHARRHEFSVRTAIGAGRTRLIRQYLTESFVIALCGASLGAACAWYGTAYLMPFFRHPNEGIGLYVMPDRTILLVTTALAVLTTILFGALPAWRAGGADPGSLLKSRTVGAGRRQLLGRAFIPIQVSLSFVLVSIASLLSDSLIRLQTEQTGFDLDHVTIQTAPLHMLNQPVEARLNLYNRMRNRLEQLPGVNAASFTFFTPMTSFQATSSFRALDDSAEPREDPRMTYNDVGPGYFRTMKTTILDGREFEERERDRSVCILNQSAAAFLFPGKQAIGRYVQTTDSNRFPNAVPCRVIGIARDAKYANLTDPPPRTIYLPARTDTIERSGNLVFLINSPTKAQAIEAYRKAKTEILPSVPYVLFATLREQMDAALGSHRALAFMSNFFAGLALFLSGLGLYGLLSSSVALRTSEIGVRMAMGAARGRVIRMILSEALMLLGIGLAVGAVVLTFTLKFAGKLLYEVSAFDPLRLAAIVVVLAAVAITAGLLPALRAASIDPIRALRA